MTSDAFRTVAINLSWFKQNSYEAEWSSDQVLGHFTLDSNRCYKPDMSGLKLYRPERNIVNKNLLADFTERGYMESREDQENYEMSSNIIHPVEWIRRNGLPSNRPQYVCRRSTMKALLTTMLLPDEPWKVDVCRHDGVTYLNRAKHDGYTAEEPIMLKKARYFGMAFENLLTEPLAGGDASDRFYTMTSWILSKLSEPESIVRVLLASEIDAVTYTASLKRSEVPLHSVIEMKTTRSVSTLHFEKAVMMWAQCVLLKTDTLVLGWRDKAGRLVNVTSLDPTALVRDVIPDKGASSFGFLHHLLSWLLKKELVEDRVYALSYIPASRRARLEEAHSDSHPMRLSLLSP